MKNLKIYLIGICGSGMSVLAKYLKFKNFYVSGSDVSIKNCNEILNLGIKVYKNKNLSEVANSDVIIYTSAIKNDNEEFILAKKLKKCILKRAEALSLIIGAYKKSVGVLGSHGKTTTTSMISNVLFDNNVNFSSFIGGNDNKLTNLVFSNENSNVIAEVCEYDKNTQYVKTDASIVLNIDNDHLDCYNTLNALKNEFYSYLNKSKQCFLCYDDENLRKYNRENVTFFSILKNSEYKAEDLKENNGKYSFYLKTLGDRINLNVYGKYNVYNALATFAVCDKYFKIEKTKIKKSLENFTGVKRRFEFLGNYNGFNIITDYCHHPTEIKNTLITLKEMFNNNYTVIFQPHTYSRTKLLFNDFINVLNNEDVYVFKTFSAREKYDYLGSGYKLSKVLNCCYIKNVKILKNSLNIAKYKKNLILLGAGDLPELFKKYIIKNN